MVALGVGEDGSEVKYQHGGGLWPPAGATHKKLARLCSLLPPSQTSALMEKDHAYKTLLGSNH